MQNYNNQQEAPCDTLVTFSIGPYRLCAPVMPVQGIISPPQITHLPLSKPTAAGVFRYHDRIALAFDLHCRFGLLSRRNAGGGLFIVTDISPGLVAFWVDEVLDIPSASAYSWRSSPTALSDNVVERFACTTKEMFLFVTYERLFRGDTQAITDLAGNRTAPSKPHDHLIEQVNAASPPNAISISPPESRLGDAPVTPITDHTGRKAAPDNSASRTHTPISRSITRLPLNRIAALQRPVAAHASKLLKRAQVTPTPPTQAPVTAMASSSTPANVRQGLGIAASLAIIVPLVLGALTYWLWPNDPHGSRYAEDTIHRSITEGGFDAASGRTAPPSATNTTPANVGTAAAMPLPEAPKAEEFVITIESPEHATRSRLASPQAETKAGKWEQVIHTVRNGDTLWAISQRYLCNPFRYPELARLSTISNPHRIYPGDRVRIKRLIRTGTKQRERPKS